jgi:iron complex transport system ATP-binding protein
MALIARALMQDADLLIMDEPAASLDMGKQLALLSRIRDMTRQGKGIIMSTHNPDHCFSLRHDCSSHYPGSPIHLWPG